MTRHLMAGSAGEDAPTLSRQILGLGLIAGSFLFAFVIQSVLFARSNWMLADLAYHRGVAYTMQGAAFQGEGPYEGLISYYGGLYPLVLGWASEVSGKSFDAILSVVSWFGTLLMPAAFLVLGRRLWRNDLFAVGFFVCLGTLAVPFTTNWEELWVESILPSGASFWPVYPRDIALALACVALWAVTSERWRVRTIGLGLIVGICGLFHAQMAILLAWFLILFAGWRAIRSRRAAPLAEVALAGGIALAITVWWWIPRVQAFAKSGELLIADHASRLPFQPGPKELLIGLGCAGVLAGLAVVVLAIRRPRDSQAWIFVAWILTFLPLIVLSRAVPSLDLFTERRLWLVISIAVIGLATCGIVVLTKRMPAVALAAIVIVTVAIPSAAGNVATERRVKNAISSAWKPGNAGMARGLDVEKWRAAMDQLNGMVRTHGRALVVTYDAFAPWAWSFSGAQVVSLWTPGPYKLGFDPKALTGEGYLERVRLLEAAFDHGPSGICGLAASQGGDAVLLRAYHGLVGFYDRSLASAYRLEPEERADAPLSREVAPGTFYVDDNQRDVVRLSKGATLTIPWEAPEVTRLGLLIAAAGAPGRNIATLATGTAEVPIDGRQFGGLGWEYVEVPKVEGGVTIKAVEDIQVLELTGFAPWPNARPPTGEGPFVVPTAELCGPLNQP